MIKYDIDWKKCHNGLMVCTFSEAYILMPEIKIILEDLIPLLELPVSEYVIDVKVHMLMPGQYPCIPNWHCDFLPRDKNNKRIKGAPVSDLKMYMWLSGNPLTEYKDSSGQIYTKEAQVWHSFTQKDVHRGTASKEHLWRCFIRVVPKSLIHANTTNTGCIRRHSQVYLDANLFRW